MTPLPGLSPAAQETLERWHGMLLNRDTGGLAELASDEIIFRSPAFFKPYPGKQAFVFIITTVSGIFENFRYDRQFATADGSSAILEFSANIGDKSLKGIDMIRFDDEGKIVEFEVMIRPANALAVLAQKMSEKAGPYLMKTGAATA
ncbi:nuclear transport factor 2 family protein [Hoeflea poritis]|uniref:Nuclear transport factor 2 family protein n=1 Tax=Hoeflea poritis TaxID=2993659 RepID=A0ABT4VHR2_9HYPH|nr:nuclear transport factor 2 family protein [Hoeflea poritis]MDA4844235.1 nuclear transport factor 2 family protein [Hoeflea poritis]